jgi:hypothetical protein
MLGTTALQAPTGKTAAAALPSITITGGRFAQPLSFSVGVGCKLTGSSLSVSADLARANDGEGEAVAWGISFDNAEVSADFVYITAQPSWTVTAPLVQKQAPSTVEPQAGIHTSSATGYIPITRGTAG